MLDLPRISNLNLPSKTQLSFNHLQNLIDAEKSSYQVDEDRIEDLRKQRDKIAKQHVINMINSNISRNAGQFDAIRQRSRGVFEQYYGFEVKTLNSGLPNEKVIDGDYQFFIQDGNIYALQLSTNSTTCLTEGIFSFIKKLFVKRTYSKIYVDTIRHILYGLSDIDITIYSTITLEYFDTITSIHSSLSVLTNQSGNEITINSLLPLSPETSNLFTCIVIFSSRYIGYVSGHSLIYVRDIGIDEQIITSAINRNAILLATPKKVFLFIESEHISMIRDEDVFLVSIGELSITRAIADGTGLLYPIDDVSFLCEYDNSTCEEIDDSETSGKSQSNTTKSYYQITLPSIRSVISKSQCTNITELRNQFEELKELFGNVVDVCFAYEAITERNERVRGAVGCARNEGNSEEGELELLIAIVRSCWKLNVFEGYEGIVSLQVLKKLEKYKKMSESIVGIGIREVSQSAYDILCVMKVMGKMPVGKSGVLSVEDVICKEKESDIKEVIYGVLVNALLNGQPFEEQVIQMKNKHTKLFDKKMEKKLIVEKALVMSQQSTNGYENDRNKFGILIYNSMKDMDIEILSIEGMMVMSGFHDLYISLVLLSLKKSDKMKKEKLESLKRVLTEIMQPIEVIRERIQKPMTSDEMCWLIKKNCCEIVSGSINVEAEKVLYDILNEHNQIDTIISLSSNEIKNYLKQYWPEILWRWYVKKGMYEEAIKCILKLCVEDIYLTKIKVEEEDIEMKQPNDICIRLRLITEAMSLGMIIGIQAQQEILKAYKILSIMNELCQKVVSIENLLILSTKLHRFEITFEVMLFYTNSNEKQLLRCLALFLEYAWMKGIDGFNNEVNEFLKLVGDAVPISLIDSFKQQKEKRAMMY
ncbi:hypothetical protein ENU1_049390 [Entamoeba nuttalli P19]|uniref:Uncharacterized protein n=1 Tax=Entamoeba nuttalli (strain P19) TaxID=1076696 RepID=K2HYY9_ENTNP|nr:hypothetical protein ENU1_049390 [Entamoeba nuttalli P19]EKE41630.1 hypothetical protein ENU1_049390 [Entamoeba nuttalli P19]|eukprot:XP_008856039.1 hypothetical protein ENU1_049390 [Entamoeba nuttalli P19]